MHPVATRALPVLVAVALLLPACAARQDNAGADLLDPRNSARQEVVADMQLNAGRALLAAQGYDKALLARPGDAGLLVKKGQALLRLNQPEAALAAFRLAQAASPDSPGAHYGAGQACERLGQGAEARQAFERAVALAPGSWRARSHLGVLLMNAGHPDQAREQFLAALALPHVQAQAQGQAGDAGEQLWNNLAVAQVLSGEPEAAVATFRLALRNSGDPERSANNLGLLLVRLGRPAEALAAFRTGGNDARALNNLGYALYLQGESARAKALFEKALDLSPAYYETAGENLKQALRAAPPNGAGAVEPGRDAVVRSASQGLASPGAARMSLSGQPGPTPRFGGATLRDAGTSPQQAY
jgi:Flp pilus assembly protein TadD